MPPGPADDCAGQASREEWPGRVRNAKQVGRFLVTAASHDGDKQDPDYVDSDRWQSYYLKPGSPAQREIDFWIGD